MATPHDAAHGGAKNWFLRLADGGVFGPVSLVTLVDWAKQGRVAASNEVSNDNATWRPADSVPELGMEWYIEAADGSLHGPFHHNAAELLAKGGRLGENPRILQAGEADLSKLRRPAAPRKAASDSQGELDFGGADAPADTDVASLREERESLRLRVNDLEEQIRQMMRSSEKEARSQERQKEALRKTIAELQREHEDLRAAAENPSPAALREALDAARREFEDEKAMLVRDADTLRARIAELEAGGTSSEDEVAALRANLETLAGEKDDALRRAEEAGQSAAAAKQSADEVAAALAAAQAAASTATDEVVALRARIAELEAGGTSSADEVAALRASLETLAGEKDDALRRAEEAGQSAAAAKQSADEAAAALAAAQAAASAARDETAALRARIVELESDNLSASETSAIDDARLVALQNELDTAKSALEAATGEAAQAGALRARIAELEETNRQVNADFAELLDSSNENDASLHREVEAAKAELEAARAEAETAKAEAEAARSEAEAAKAETESAKAAAETARSEAEAAKAEAVAAKAAAGAGASAGTTPEGAALPGRFSIELAECIDVFERVLETEREETTAFQDASQQRQNLLRERVAALRKLQQEPAGEPSGEETDGKPPAMVSAREAARLRDELANLRVLHQRAMREAGDRERDLTRRVRSLESSDVRMQERLAESEGMRRRVQELSEQLRLREQDLEQERRMRKFEQEQAQQVQATMNRQIESLQRHDIAAESIVVNTADAALAAPPSETPPPPPTLPPPPRRFTAPPWMARLRRK